ncbi:hypothetical protein [Rubrobacter aplysinae]|uniref:hypothetical protein n=1 Tax=Rubrobacter aplysinae TaxID=909625 RepID=UPI00064C1051|nr:hypothetical protein [Rubrobacter aplysinae]
MASRRTAQIILSPTPSLLIMLILTLVIGGCSGGDDPPETTSGEFQEGTISSGGQEDPAGGTSSLPGGTTGSPGETVLRVEGGKRTRFSGLCMAGDREYVISGRPSRTYSFEESSFSCRIQKQDSGGGNLKVTVVSGDSTRSVQQTNAGGGVVNVSHDVPGGSAG